MVPHVMKTLFRDTIYNIWEDDGKDLPQIILATNDLKNWVVELTNGTYEGELLLRGEITHN